MSARVKFGIIGCGNIFPHYARYTKPYAFVELAACADLDLDRARERAEEFGVPRACTVEELLADPEIQIVVNLTYPIAHAEVSLQALRAGKHVYSEKPIGIALDEARAVVETARERGLKVACAPDTMLGAGIQTCRRLIDEGRIGEPVAAVAFLTNHGMEHWHPDPEFFYKRGGGPMLDMGPYYVSALLNLLGPARRVSGSARITFPERLITSQAKHGEHIRVETPTHLTGTVEFARGPIATLLVSNDIWGANLPRIEIYGSEGSLSVPDPNLFGGPVRLLGRDGRRWEDVPHTHREPGGRGIGVAELASAIFEDREPRASAALALHALEIMLAFEQSSAQGRHIDLATTCEQPEALPSHWPSA